MPTFDEERLVAHKAQILRVDAAIQVVLTGGTEYSLDSGQTRQTVTRSSLSDLQKMLAYLEGEIRRLEGAVNISTGAAVVVRPGF